MELQEGFRDKDASGNVKVDRSKVVKGGEPYILFKEDNAAGLKLFNTLPVAKENLAGAIKQNPDVKINIDKLTESNASSVQENNRVILGSSAIQISNNTLQTFLSL